MNVKIKSLQILTLILLAVVIVLNSILKINTEVHDLIAIIIFKVSVVGSGIWLTFIIIFSIIRGSSIDPIASILKKIRELFTIRTFLISSIIVFSMANIFIVYQLIYFRQVEFIADRKIKLYQNKKVGDIREIGVLDSTSPRKFRLRNGNNFIFYEILENGQRGSIEKLRVVPFWKDQQVVRIKTKIYYEKL